MRCTFALANQKKSKKYRNMKQYLDNHYDLRVNLLRQATEFRLRDEAGQPIGQYRQMDVMTINSIYFRMKEAGIRVRFHELECYLFSDMLPQYHPFTAYMASLPEWDGRDRVNALARRVSKDKLWIKVFRIWMRALAAQWMGHEMQAPNSMVPILISQKQGLGKSTFCRMLVPPELQNYYLDKVDFTQAGEYTRMMVMNGLINLDEIDALTQKAMAKFKSAATMKSIVGHSTRTEVITNRPRLASFIGTSNKMRLLHDSTGSRRFYCQVVEKAISCRPINYEQLFAQLQQEMLRGERTWFTKSEERLIEEHNRGHYLLAPLQQYLLRMYRPAKESECEYPLSARDLYDALSARYPLLTADVPLAEFGKQLSSIFPRSKRRNYGYDYYVLPIRPAS